jgi:hypothetical protein
MKSNDPELGTQPTCTVPQAAQAQTGAGAGGIVRHDFELLPVVDEEAVLDGLADLALYLSEPG